MENIPYISVIIVAYNYGQYLPRALEACKNQTFTDFELILVNNGSTDNTQDIIDSFILNNPQLSIKPVQIEENDGPAKGRNLGIRCAKGTYLLFNDADDWMDPNCLELLAEASENGKYDRVCGQYRDVSPEGKILQTRTYPKDISKWYITMIQANLFKREIFVKKNITVPKVYSDDYYIANIFNSSCSDFKIIQNTIYNYFVNEHSNTGAKGAYSIGKSLDMFEEFCSINETLKEQLKPNELSELQYQLVKLYFFELLHYNRYCNYKQLLDIYQQLHKIIVKYEPNYLKNINLTLFKNNRDRFYGRAITFMLCHAERFHLIKGCLYLYNCLSKHVFFRV